MRFPFGNLPLTWRLVLLSGISLLCVTIISTLVARDLMRSEFDQIRDRELQLMTDHILAELAELQQVPQATLMTMGPPRFSEIFSGAYWRFQPEQPGEAAPLRSRSLWDGAISDIRITAELGGLGIATGPAGEQLRVWTGPAQGAGLKGTLLVGIRTSEHLAMQERVGWLFTIALVIEGLLALAVAVAAAIVSLRSIRRFTAGLQALRAGETEQIDEDLSSEIAIAAREVNALKGAQTRMITRAREQAAALAHSLKTPLAVIIQSAEKTAGPEAGEIRQQADAALTHVRQHLAMARSAAPLAMQQSTPLWSVVDGIARVLRSRAGENGVVIGNEVPDGLRVPVEEADLHDIIGNLVENAVRHANAAVVIHAEASGETTSIAIEDDGPGLDAGAQQTALRRGFSSAGDPASTGLGLSITRDLVESYSGEFSLETSDTGGLKVLLRFRS